jgi:GNAT superfamily N-acetyltransferase
MYGEYLEIVSLVVDEAYRGQGVGKCLLDAATDWAQGQAIAKVALYSNQIRDKAHHFYYRNGYQKIKESIFLEKNLETE